ncbi:signal peptidase I [Romboutsia sedimentorum]|uniref:Signal peptidase I n=1 Tax=Romboutsia sedimentorum TaxID=1368474 RepID=A0ABT7EAB7_9FIRM|nr:signal peptidase I [Romboutsia sedimentorum]MDK2563868.1 signal peptidase I [Romboutsia sedimentorum]
MSAKLKKEIFEWVKTIAFALVLAAVITSVVAPTIVSGESMYPTLKDKDYLFVNKLAYMNKAPKRGDIIVFKTKLVDEASGKNKDLVKRVIGIPGEHIVIKDNKVIINDKVLSEEYLKDVYTDGDIDMIIPNNHIFAMGDNRPNSGDSRQPNLGPINIDEIIGKVMIRMYPFNTLGKVE